MAKILVLATVAIFVGDRTKPKNPGLPDVRKPPRKETK